ncbi:hypothetical protein H0N99_05070 [Candidatus Micrarchaeota archaeon]|nr:hypothetical protein [Candidatus Micrarchaeota archaeon]
MTEANKMLSAEEILELKREHHSLEKRMEEIEKNQRSTIVKLSERLKELMADIGSVREKEKSMWNPDLSTRIKLSKKGIKLSKELNYFVMDAASEFEKGNIPEDAGKRFISLAKLIKGNRMDLAKKEFEYFEEIIELGKTYEKSEEEMKEQDRILKREQARVEAILAEMSELEKGTVDLGKVLSYENLLKNLGKLEKLRETYIHSLISEPVAELLEDIEKYSLKDYCQALPGKGEMAELKEFFSEYPAFGKCNVNQLCEFFEYSEKKLSHICPETSRFRRLVVGNKNLFETILSLGKTTFLAMDDANEKVMDFYAERIEGAQEIVEQIGQLRKEKYSYKEEYEKNKKIEKTKEELSKYSKNGLEAELRDIEHLLELLHSNRP